jgi:hypothetical protein
VFDDSTPINREKYSPESLGVDEVCRGQLHKTGENGYMECLR